LRAISSITTLLIAISNRHTSESLLSMKPRDQSVSE
jgi:hypothetical protein